MLSLGLVIFTVVADVAVRRLLKKGKAQILHLDRGEYLPKTENEETTTTEVVQEADSVEVTEEIKE